MSNLDVAVGSFWQLARHWKNGDKAKLELSCEDGSLHMQLSAVLGLPDQPHFSHPPPPSHHAPPPPPPPKKKSPSQLRRQERRQREAEVKAANEAVSSLNINSEEHESELLNDVSNPKETENVLEAYIEEPAEKLPQNVADESKLGFKCNQCEYSNATEKGLGMHIRKKHRISQVDGVDDSYEEHTKDYEVKGLDPCPLCKDALEVPDHGNCGKWGSHGVGFSGGNCVNCHLILNIKGVHCCEAICNGIVEKVCERCKLHCKTL